MDYKVEAKPGEFDAPFSHTEAQKYELAYSKGWVREYQDYLRKSISAALAGDNTAHPNFLKEFFGESQKLWDDCIQAVRGKTVIDIGTGPTPHLLSFPWAGRRIIIDPLGYSYKEICDEIDPAWFSGIEVRQEKAETFLPDLEGVVDGMIVCRNCIDHTEEPFMILNNIASYAAPGCTVLFWADIYHLEGHNEGHRNVSRDKDGMRRLFKNLGFNIIREVPDTAHERTTLSWGCTAEKR